MRSRISKRESALRKATGVFSTVRFDESLTVEDFIGAVGYVYRTDFPKEYKQKCLYVGQSTLLDSRSMSIYLGSGTEYTKFLETPDGTVRNIEKTIIAFVKEEGNLNNIEHFYTNKIKPRFNKYNNLNYVEKNKKYIDSKKEESIKAAVKKFKPIFEDDKVGTLEIDVLDKAVN